MYYGKSSSSKIAIAKQRAVSRKIMATIDYQMRYEEKRESQQFRLEVNSYWLKKLIAAVEMEVSNELDILCLLRENVFSKWEKHKYNREFYLAHNDIYHELTQYPVEIRQRVEAIALELREERKKSESIHK